MTKKLKQNVLKYEAVFEEAREGGYTVFVPSLPGCISEADTFEQAKENIKEAIELYLESLAKDGEEIPDSSSSVLGMVEVSFPKAFA